MANAKIRLYVAQALIAALRDSLRAFEPIIPIQFPGSRDDAPSSSEGWVAPLIINFSPENIGGSDYAEAGIYQVSCFARYAERRADGDTLAPQRIAANVAEIARKTFAIYDESIPQVHQGCVFLGRPSEQYIDESDMPGQTGSRRHSNTNIHAVVLTFPIFITSI